MTELFVALPFAVLASWQLVETFHHGDLFANFRARLEAKGGLFSELMLCPFCLSHWTALLVCAQVMLAFDFEWSFIKWWWAPYWLSVVRLSNVFNDLGHSFWRTSVNLEEEMAALEDIPPPTENGTGTQDAERPPV